MSINNLYYLFLLYLLKYDSFPHFYCIISMINLLFLKRIIIYTRQNRPSIEINFQNPGMILLFILRYKNFLFTCLSPSLVFLMWDEIYLHKRDTVDWEQKVLKVFKSRKISPPMPKNRTDTTRVGFDRTKKSRTPCSGRECILILDSFSYTRLLLLSTLFNFSKIVECNLSFSSTSDFDLQLVLEEHDQFLISKRFNS